jgi:hypothetical protein
MERLARLADRARGLSGAIVAAARNPARVPSDEQARRLAICDACEFFLRDKNRCAKCGCRLNWKSRLEAWHCPIQKW